MANTPDFASTVVAGFVTTAATAATGAMGNVSPTAGNLNTILQAGVTGAKVEQIDVLQILATGGTGGRINIWRSANTAATGPYALVDQFLVSPVAANATTQTAILSHYFTNLFLNANDVLSCSIMEAQNQSAFGVNGYAGSF